MAKKTPKEEKKIGLVENVEIANAGEMVEANIVDTLRVNYMPYAMSVIISRALPEIDGLTVSQKTSLYDLTWTFDRAKDKFANVVGQTRSLILTVTRTIYEKPPSSFSRNEHSSSCHNRLKRQIRKAIAAIWHMRAAFTE